MAMDLLGARLTALHDSPSVDAALIGARLAVLHDSPPASAALIGARLTALHDSPPASAALIGARLAVLHELEASATGGAGLQSIGARRAEGAEQRSGLIDLRHWWRFA